MIIVLGYTRGNLLKKGSINCFLGHMWSVFVLNVVPEAPGYGNRSYAG